MRVLHISEVGSGGVMTHLWRILPALQASGIDNATILPARSQDEDGRVNQAEPLEQAGIPVTRLRMSRRAGPFDVGAILGIRSRITALQPDVVHTHSTHAGLWTRLALVGVSGPGLLHSPHGFAACRYSDPPRRSAAVLAERTLGRRVDRYVLGSEDERALATETYRIPRDRISVVPNGLPTSFQRDLVPPAEARTQLGLPLTGTTLLFAGRLEPQKAPDVAALAAARMARARPFVFAGLGSLERRVRGILHRNHCEERCRLVGEIAELPSLLRAFDILVLPSRYEGLPYVLLEALAAGLRVVAANAPGTRLAHPFGKEIATVPPNAPDVLATELDRAVEQTEAEKRGPARTPQLPPVPDRYRLDTQVRSLLKLYTQRETRG